MSLSKEITRIINSYSKYIDDNDFTYIYNDLHFAAWSNAINADDIGQFTLALNEADIWPLNHINFVPGFYLHGTDITGIYLPDNIKLVEESAFEESGIEEIDFGKNTTRIEQSACSDCGALDIVKMHPNLQSIAKEVFYGCSNLTEIIFTGTKDEWKSITKAPGWRAGAVNLHLIICSDGDIEI